MTAVWITSAIALLVVVLVVGSAAWQTHRYRTSIRRAMLPTASGEDLDLLAQVFGERRRIESDDELRTRVMRKLRIQLSPPRGDE